MRSTSAGISIAIHLSVMALMSFLGARVARTTFQKPVRIIVPLTAPPRLLHGPAGSAAGGGGSEDSLPARRGTLPRNVIAKVFVPPSAEPRDAKLAVPVAILDAPDIAINAVNYGDPNGVLGALSGGGRGKGGGYGDGCCGSAGDGHGRRYGDGDDKGGRPGSARLVYSSMPRLVYKIEPEYPDEARKSRFEGTVVLNVEIDATGRPHILKVVRALGLGLDERAVEAVQKWRFTPAIAAGKPTPAAVIVEVSFRLL